ncbi:MAG: lipoate--protein ligase family protein [Candidatus Omnitrophota bacterium]
MGKTWRLILDQKNDGYYNMAADEAILLHYAVSKTPTLRVYGWKEPIISLGYNQKAQEVLNPQGEIPFVRRITGGSAILHHKELTYSLICSREDLKLPQGVKKSYKIICSFLKYFYSQLGLEANFAIDLLLQEQGDFNSLGQYKNSCFSAWQHFDLLVGGRKIGGNAQRRKKNIIFQQGSIPQEIDFSGLSRAIKDSSSQPSRATSLIEALGKPLSFNFLRSLLALSFKRTFGIEFKQEGFLPLETIKATYLLEEKYKLDNWNIDKIVENVRISA